MTMRAWTRRHRLHRSCPPDRRPFERSPRTIYNLIADGELPAVKIRGLIRVPSAALEQWIDDKSGEALNAVRQRDDGP